MLTSERVDKLNVDELTGNKLTSEPVDKLNIGELTGNELTNKLRKANELTS